ncbi:hypothetical protein KO494_09755 [Lacinutrix sp. C3R15]|uniref:hypothetical protein n=1 Tax=Flavobacteriaceae TaxID=49546 RepID=UPI001C098C95|nr:MULTISPECIES: hypothetical protein [Flavobacteriaceae]MBU2939823.1 hypothetical protein [Lacinutrix sp. C3R15]MDO6623139.1 hypothetical protein [Oceanihabitans sp. 1_MG-2023]
MKTKLLNKRKIHHRNIVFYALLFMVSFSYAQIGIGNTNPQATLDITATNPGAPSNQDGLLIPRVNIFPPTPTAAQQGMLIYLTTAVGSQPKGFYHWDQPTTSWIRFSSIEKLNDLSDGKSDVDGTNDGSSVFLGINAGLNDDADHNQNVGVGYNALMTNVNGDANSAFGFEALSLNTSLNNSAFGFRALANNSTGRRNSAFGRGALEGNTTANFNTAVGTQAMATNTSGASNVAVGESSLFSNDSGSNNTAVGTQALYTNTGNDNVAIGNEALHKNTTGTENVAIGNLALYDNQTGAGNTAIGTEALADNTSGESTAVGYHALFQNVDGLGNTGVGYEALNNNISASNNVAFGYGALKENISGNNTAIGALAGELIANNDANSTSNVLIGHLTGNELDGSNNVIVGQQAGRYTVGDENVFLGRQSGRDNLGSGNVFIGNRAGLNGDFDLNSNTLIIQNSNGAIPLIYGEFDNNIFRVNGELQVAEPGVTNGYAFPLVDGTQDQILVTDGAGQLTFEDPAPNVSTFPLIRATMNTNQPLGTSGWEKVAFNNVALNPTGSTEFQTGNNRFVVAAGGDGIYRIDASYHTTLSQTNTDYYGIAVYINGGLYQEFSVNHYYDGTNSSQVARQISCVANVTAGQSIEIFVNNSQAGVVLDSFAGKTNFTIERIR